MGTVRVLLLLPLLLGCCQKVETLCMRSVVLGLGLGLGLWSGSGLGLGLVATLRGSGVLSSLVATMRGSGVLRSSIPPELSPISVIRSPSPPKAAACARSQRSAAITSRSPFMPPFEPPLPGRPLISSETRKPSGPSR